MMINIIAACDHNRVMGRQGRLPWNIPEDWTYFLEQTEGGVLLMGRRCYEDFIDYAPQREVIGLSRNPHYQFEHARRAHSLNEGLALARQSGKTIWICGGYDIYKEALPLANELFLTEIDAQFEGDTHFPDWKNFFPKKRWTRTIQTKDFKITFSVYIKGTG
jgi:dihydrofolate reductase